VKKYLGPILFFIGAAVAVVGILYFRHAQPRPGAVIDTIPVDKGIDIVVRAEQGGDRSFVELHMNGAVKWSALIPHYAGAPGRPAIAWGPTAVTARFERDGQAEVFAFAMRDAQKIGGYKLAPEHAPITTQARGPITLTDHIRAYELVGGRDWHQILAVDLATGKGVWKRDLGPAEITDGGVDAGSVWLVQDGKRRLLDPATGAVK
jgi:outer membrane protein assembly factor BamB